MTDNTRITELLQPYLNDGYFYIVDIQIAGQQGGRIKVSVLVDSDTGITIEECASISRRLGAVLDETDLFNGAAFILEVSSPGVDLPLRFPRQYVRNVGRQLAVALKTGALLKGRLDEVTDDYIVLDIVPAKKLKKKKKGVPVQDGPAEETPEPAGPTPVPFADIQQATVEISFK